MTTKLNQAQILLLNALASINKQEEVNRLNSLITDFLMESVDGEMEELWQKGIWSDSRLKSLENAHYRTPYK